MKRSPFHVVISIVVLFGCLSRPAPVTIVADGQRRTVYLRAATVREALTQAGISLGDLDQVSPPETARIAPGMVITVTRITQTLEIQEVRIPFPRQILKDARLAPGETRLIRRGEPGLERVTIRITWADGQPMERQEIQRERVRDPVPEIVAVSLLGEVVSMPISGTLVFLARRDAWQIAGETSRILRLTSLGDLDGRIFTLSPDGRFLLFSRASSTAPRSLLNTVWGLSLGADPPRPQPVGLENVLWLEWAPQGDRVAFATGEPSPGPPGWRAHNDLWIGRWADGRIEARRVLTPTAGGPYGWWGMTWAWSPDGRRLAFGRTDGIGVLDLESRKAIPLLTFPVYETRSAWAWVPALSWSPDGRYLAALAHGPPRSGEPPEQSTRFDLWILAVDEGWARPLIEDVGLWAGILWSPQGLFFGQAHQPEAGDASRYDLYWVDHDGSDRRRLFPPEGEIGFGGQPDMRWAPDGQGLLVRYQGDLYYIAIPSGQVYRLTAQGDIAAMAWR
ncbi:G5 domain-containing protein [Thermoflexus sp.]|uniref:G5 domain-containing protein n=1 Tax=Thermoflexus sp. TaxID=1969742 RepID=UPI0025E48547|nr:G5 domain-containing protein [Thermoflexus sp.]MDW8181294.1 G5 domain-containing protein [Anaerolineae bacterium]MCS6964070.1 G5 domain-containing protein [Thermoflexus sp.]MCS7351835.1 G5 domain-containing protein [Thermoflexus sp.]MCX7691686.1 G5 domain-containing protein [Thermoflexus sp.]MDW8183869.1 G5 domain-containing protein [Anaerolineae bacterium]